MNRKWTIKRLGMICLFAVLVGIITGGEVMAAPDCRESHIVQRGETLSHIARYFGTTVRELQFANNINNVNRIDVGQRLCIPSGVDEHTADEHVDANHTNTTGITAIQALTNINVRTGPSLRHMIVGHLGRNAIAEVVGQSDDGLWWRIVCPVGEGSGCWVTAQQPYTRPVTAQSPTPQASIILGTEVTAVSVVAERALLYAGPGSQYPVVGSMFGGLPIPVDGVSADGGWWHASCPNAAGTTQCDYWVSASPQTTQSITFPQGSW